MITVNVGLLASCVGLILTLSGVILYWANLRQRFLTLERHDRKHNDLLILIAKAQFAALDGLKQQGCNGEVTKAREELRKYLIEH